MLFLSLLNKYGSQKLNVKNLCDIVDILAQWILVILSIIFGIGILIGLVFKILKDMFEPYLP